MKVAWDPLGVIFHFMTSSSQGLGKLQLGEKLNKHTATETCRPLKKRISDISVYFPIPKIISNKKFRLTLVEQTI